MGPYSVTNNQVFGININGSSSLTVTGAALTVSPDVLGIQIGTAASGFIADNQSTLTLSNNATDGHRQQQRRRWSAHGKHVSNDYLQ